MSLTENSNQLFLPAGGGGGGGAQQTRKIAHMYQFGPYTILEEISINPYMDTSVCCSDNAITVCKYVKSSCHCNCFFTRYGKLVHLSCC